MKDYLNNIKYLVMALTDIKKWTIYKMTNPVGEIYVGRTSDLKGRKANYRGLSKSIIRQRLIYESLVKYGYENHAIDILDEFESEKLYAEGKEIFWIRSQMSNRNQWPDQNGLNLCIGGQGSIGMILSKERKEAIGNINRGKPMSDEQKKKISKTKAGQPNLKLRGRKMSDSQKAHLSKVKTGKPNLKRRGIPLSDEAKNKISVAKKGQPSPNKGVKYSDERKKQIGLSKIGNTNMLGKNHTQETKNKLKEAHACRSKAVIQMNLSGDIINEFISLRDCARQLNLYRTSIAKVLNGKWKYYHSFIFKYKNIQP